MANSITHRLARDLKVYVKKQDDKHLVSFNDISVLLDYLDKKNITKLKDINIKKNH